MSKVALVTGGSRGIGRAIAVRLAASGFDIWLNYRSNHEAAAEAKAEIEALGRVCDLLPFDVGDYEAARIALEARVPAVVPEAVVFNAGIARDNLAIFMSRDEWETVINTNLNGFFNVIRPLIFHLLSRKSGRIVAIASTSGEIGQAGQMNYAASKAGLIGAVKSLAREVGRKGVLVNAVSPGVIATEMTADLPVDKLLDLIPVRRLGEAAEVAEVVNFLCTQAPLYIHGQVIGVNGGLAI